MTAIATATRAVPVSPVTQTSAIKAEWRKLSTLRSTWFTLLAAVVSMIGIGAAAGWATNAHWADMHPDELAHFSAIDTSLLGINLAQLIVGALGVLVITGEYATGMIRSTLAAVPQRLPVLWAKLVVFGVMILIAMALATVVAFLTGQALLASHGTTFGAAHAVRAVFGSVYYLTVVGVLAVAIGFIVRSTAGGVAAIAGLLLVLPNIGAVLPRSWQTHVLPYLPSNAGSALFGVQHDSTTLAPLTGAVVLLGWAVVLVAAAAWCLRRRDA